MNETQEPPVTGKSAPPPLSPEQSAERLRLAEASAREILRLMEVPSRVEVKDAPDGGISLAIFLEGDVQGFSSGRRSHVVDALQFLLNKMVNKPGVARRWIGVGIGGHPEPRPPPGERRPPVQQQSRPEVAPNVGPATSASTPVTERPGRQQGQSQDARPSRSQGGGRSPETDERKLDPSEDPDLAKAARELAEKAASLGRFYAISPMKPEDRARILRAVVGVEGVTVDLVGEGRNRRVVFTPHKPVPMPKRGAMPDDDDEESED
jgi:predicted RNA-binding protein Jag